MLNAGELDRHIDIERKTVSQDEYGGEVETWTKLVARRAAGVKPLRGDERFVARQFVAKQHVEFVIRWAPTLAGLTPLDRIVYPPTDATSPPTEPPADQIFDIVEVSELGRREGLKILATRRAE
jgi:head-tail adaptor